MNSNIMTVQEVAKELGLSESCVKTWFQEGILPGWQHKSTIRIFRSVVDEMLDAAKVSKDGN